MRGRVYKKGPIVRLQIGKDVYQYDERQQPLGAGAMGVVYKGFNIYNNLPVAIKRIVDKYANMPEIRYRAYQEADLMFRHPNLVEMLGCCEQTPNKGSLFLISNYVNGENIDTFINQHMRTMPNAEKRICELFLPVLDALAYIHQKGIIHMDIKPSNIMMENGRNIRLMDLGIANISDTVNATTSGMMGTPKYAAPEQFSDIDTRPKLTIATDIYEAGITLYELITQKNPFTANTIAEAKEKHWGMIVPMTANISKSVYDVIKKATNINPELRYQSATAMKIALRQAIVSSPPNTVNWQIIIVIIVIIVMIIAVIFFLVVL